MQAARIAALESLDTARVETLRFFDAPAAQLDVSYAPGKWTLREILIHLSDAETVLLDRLRRLASEPNPALMAFDQDLWAASLFYKRRDLSLARAQFDTARKSVLELLRNLDDSVETRSGMHSEAGTRTFAQILKMIGDHNLHHLTQLKAISEGRTWSKA